MSERVSEVAGDDGKPVPALEEEEADMWVLNAWSLVTVAPSPVLLRTLRDSVSAVAGISAACGIGKNDKSGLSRTRRPSNAVADSSARVPVTRTVNSVQPKVVSRSTMAGA